MANNTNLNEFFYKNKKDPTGPFPMFRGEGSPCPTPQEAAASWFSVMMAAARNAPPLVYNENERPKED